MAQITRFFGYHVYLKIAEPRIFRILQFAIYGCLLVAGLGIVSVTPTSLKHVVGPALADVIGAFLILGAAVGMFAVLPGIWWLERVGIILLVSGLGMYFTVVVVLNTSPVGSAVALAFVLTFAQRWWEIRAFQLAPLDAVIEE